MVRGATHFYYRRGVQCADNTDIPARMLLSPTNHQANTDAHRQPCRLLAQLLMCRLQL